MTKRKSPNSKLGEEHSLLHNLWTKAVGTPGYNKTDWIKLEQILMTKKKIYIVRGSYETTESDDYSDVWSITLTKYYFLEAYKEKKLADERILKLQEAVSLWCKALRQPELRDGVRGSVFLQELAEKVGDHQLSEESEYDIIEVELE